MAVTVNSELDVAVLVGGRGPERAISLLTGASMLDALRAAGWTARAVELRGNDAEIRALDCDVAVLGLHGEWGEDGTVQRLLAARAIPFTGTHAEASRLCMDKIASKEKLREWNLPTPAWVVLEPSGETTPQDALAAAGMELPVVVKPAGGGSSVGTSIVHENGELASALAAAWAVEPRALVETYIDGRELTVGFLGDEALPVIELRTARAFYTYEAKYEDDGTEYLCPAPLEESLARQVQMVAKAVRDALNAEHYGRVDLMLKDSVPYVLELNTLPGFTSHSLVPKAAAAAGIAMPELMSRLVEMALRRARGSISERRRARA